MKLILALAAITLLTSCGGDDSNTTTDTQQTQSVKLNDTGIILGGNATGANSTTCTSSIDAKQDCHYGRDASLTISDSTFTYVNSIQTAKVGAGAAGFDFTKLSSTGTILPATADSWSCVKDNITGLVWEVKTDLGASDTFTTTTNGGVRTYTSTSATIHHKDNTYRWGGLTAVGKGLADSGTYYNDWNVLVNGSNSESLCGFSDWRVPTINELDSIVHKGRIEPSIDSNYFPNTATDYYFWSNSPNAKDASNAWQLVFDYGYNYISTRGNNGRVRLVRFGG